METSFPLIQTKLHVPVRRARSVARPRLFDLLDGYQTARLLLIAAPAGFGKTTLVVDWLHQADIPAAWISLDERDNDFTRFLIYLIAAVQTQIAGFGQELAASMQQPQPPNGQLAMDAFLSELATAATAFVLVLDDYHLIENTEIHQCLATLIDYLPPQVHLVITGRSAPELPLARWRARGQMVEVTAADLRFDDREAQDFLRNTMELALSDREVSDLEQRTEGWAAGLQLAALSVRGVADQSAAILSFTGGDRHVADYLISEVMARQPASIQHFLEQTSILERFNSDLCDYLLEGDDAQQQLEAIDRENLFLIALDSRREWYRYHHLFGELLRARLARGAGGEGMAHLHRRAAAWYAEQGQIDDAVRHALAGNDAALAARLVAAIPLEVLWQAGSVGAIRRWVDDLPEAALLAHPRAAFIGAVAHLLVGDIAATRRYVALTEDSAEMDAERKLLQAIFARNEGRMDVALDLLQAAHQELRPHQWLAKSIADLQIVVAHLENGELARPGALLREMKRGLKRNSQAGMTMMVQATAFECMLSSLQGNLSGTRRIGREAVAMVQESGHMVPIVGQIHAVLAGVAYLQNDLDETQAELGQALHWGERTGITDILFNTYDTQIKLHCARKEPERALAGLQRVRTLYEGTGFADIIRVGRAEEAAIHLRLGNLAQAMRWAAEAGHDLTDPIPPRSRSIYHILASVYLAAARIERDSSRLGHILELAERLAERGEQLGQVLAQISALLLQAQALALLGKEKQAGTRLTQALTLAEPGKIIRIFADSSPALLDLLRPLAAAQPGNAFLAAVIQASEQEEQVSPLVDPLTERELEILGLIAAGLSNKQIEACLVVSHNTVRTHIKNLYAKLAVSSRTQAVRKGQDLGLI